MHTSTTDRPALRPRANNPASPISAWSALPGQRVTLVQRGLRRRTVEATVLAGALAVTDRPEPGLELVLTIDGSTDMVTVSSRSAQALTITNNGVFRQRGRPESLWLTVRATFRHVGAAQLRGRAKVTMSAELTFGRTDETLRVNG